MKGMMLYLAAMVLLLPLTVKSQEGAFDLETERKVRFGLGLAVGEIADSSDKIDSAGLDLSMGLIFPFSENFTTDSTLHFNVLALDEEQLRKTTSTTVDQSYFYDLTVTQKLAYNFYANSTILRPYIEVGLGRGNWHTEITEVSGGSVYDAKIDIKYWKLGGSLGFDVVFTTGFSLFLQYDMYKYNFDDTADVEASGNGITVNQSVDIDQGEDVDVTGFTLGLAYIF